MPKPRIFISHSEKNRDPTNYVINLLHYLGCIPVVVEDLPRSNSIVSSLVKGSMESCDAIIVIATSDLVGDSGNSPSQGVTIEIGKLQDNEKFKDKWFIVKEDTVNFGPMIPESRYKFSKTNFGPIAEALIIELVSRGLLKNYYELKGSELKIHELMEILDQLTELANKNILSPEQFKECVEKLVRNTVDRIVGGNH